MSTVAKALLLSVSLSLVVVSSFVCAQEERPTIQQEIDQSVWKPFRSAFEKLNGSALNALYADRVLRVTPQGLDTEGQFKSSNLSRFVEHRAHGDQLRIDFWFDHRANTADTAYEVGFFRLTSVSASGTRNEHFGQFHIVLRKIDGQWKITQDWDTEHIGDEPITAALFARKPVHKLE